jgi:hypothetical protein
MTNFFTGIIGIGMLAAFIGFILIWLKALPLIIICAVVFVLLIIDFARSMQSNSA